MLMWEQQYQIWREQDAEEEAARRARDAEREGALTELIAEEDRKPALRIARQDCKNGTHDDCPICGGSGYLEEQIDVDQARSYKCSTCDGVGYFNEPCPGCPLCARRAKELLADWKAEEELADYIRAVPLWAGEPVAQESAMERARRRAPRRQDLPQRDPYFTLVETSEYEKGA